MENTMPTNSRAIKVPSNIIIPTNSYILYIAIYSIYTLWSEAAASPLIIFPIYGRNSKTYTHKQRTNAQRVCHLPRDDQLHPWIRAWIPIGSPISPEMLHPNSDEVPLVPMKRRVRSVPFIPPGEKRHPARNSEARSVWWSEKSCSASCAVVIKDKRGRCSPHLMKNIMIIKHKLEFILIYLVPKIFIDQQVYI